MNDGGSETAANLIKHGIECAIASLEKYSDGKLDRFGLEGGVALELLCKAYLAGIDMSLIVDTSSKRAFDHLLIARGHPGATVPRGMLRTIGADEAVRRVAQLLPTLHGYPDQLRLLLESRNGFLHLAEVDSETVRTVFTRYVAAMSVVGEALNLDLGTLFGPYEGFASGTLSASAEDVRAYVAAETAKARQRFEARYGHLTLKTRRAMINIAEQSITLRKYEEQRVPCPACGQLAVASGDYEVGEWEVDSYDRGGAAESAHLPVTLHAFALNCPVCGLELRAGEELDAASVETHIEVGDVDPRDFYES